MIFVAFFLGMACGILAATSTVVLLGKQVYAAFKADQQKEESNELG